MDTYIDVKCPHCDSTRKHLVTFRWARLRYFFTGFIYAKETTRCDLCFKPFEYEISSTLKSSIKIRKIGQWGDKENLK